VLISGHITQIMHMRLDEARLSGFTQERHIQGCEELRENCDDIDAH
jgi:hypothetical protein